MRTFVYETQTYCVALRLLSRCIWQSLKTPPPYNHALFVDGVIFRALKPRYLPGPGEGARRRLIFIGDIHGCLATLKLLLEKVKYDSTQDHIISTGDVINKGPKSKDVVAFLMREQASCVRGNHDDRIINLAKLNLTEYEMALERGLTDREKAEQKIADQKLAETLMFTQINWLNAQPHVLSIEPWQKFHHTYVVHGGLLPGLNPRRQLGSEVMNMRSIDIGSLNPKATKADDISVRWFDVWNAYQRLVKLLRYMSFGSVAALFALQPKSVIYGHDSRLGLQDNPYSKGLDTGCVSGGHLTAWVVSYDAEPRFYHVKRSDEDVQRKVRSSLQPEHLL